MMWQLARRAGAILGLAAGTWLALSLVLYLLLYRTLGDVYRAQLRDVLQVSCGRSVANALIYTLAPGTCRFANAEFDTAVTADADGFRNTPAQLGRGPVRVAVVGDSHAMGWGIEQADKLSSLLARDPRFTVRDLAMSSYGTARELLALGAHARDADVIVLQYCDNDRSENATFLSDPSHFIEAWQEKARDYAGELDKARKAVAAGSTFRTGMSRALGLLSATWYRLGLPPRSPRETPAAVLAEEARLFAGVMAHHKRLLADKTVIVFDSYPRTPRTGFAPAFREALAKTGLGGIVVMDLAGVIGPRDYFHIDEHMRASGHAKLARAILAGLDRPIRMPASR